MNAKNKETVHYHLSDFIQGDETFQIVHREIDVHRNVVMHDHDYYEILWITRGSGYQIVNKQRMALERGDMVMIRPSDTHMIMANKGGLIFINIAFSADTAELMRVRYFDNPEQYFWSKGLLPAKIHIDDQHIDRFTNRAHEAMRHRLSYIQLDSLLLFILRNIITDESEYMLDIPIWLYHALAQYKTPKNFKMGREGFAQECGRNIDYINRVVRKHLHMSLTDLLNNRKMQWAALQLTSLDTPIKEICLNCGFNNLGHFYKVFKQFYTQTPQQYRSSNQQIV